MHENIERKQQAHFHVHFDNSTHLQKNFTFRVLSPIF